MSELIALLAVIVSAVGGYYFTALVLRLAQRRSTREHPKSAVEVDQQHPRKEAGGFAQERSQDKQEDLDEDVPIAVSSNRVEGGKDAAGEGFARHGNASAGEGPDGIKAKEALRGGLWIGVLERSLITAFLLLDMQAGIAVVIAVKGLGRYPELNAATSERFIIGTLASLSWACFCAVLALQFVHR